MAFLQHGAACIRGLAPFSRVAAGVSRRSSRHTPKRSQLVIKGSVEGGTDEPSLDPKPESLTGPFHQIGDRPMVERGAAKLQKVSIGRDQSLRQGAWKASQQGLQAGTGSPNEAFQAPAVQATSSKSIVDIYGPYVPPPSMQAGEAVENVESDGGVVHGTKSSVVGGKSVPNVEVARPTQSSPEVAESSAFKSKGASSATPELISKTAVQSHPPKRLSLELNPPTNLTSSIGVAPTLSASSDSGNDAYAAFSAFAVLPLLLVLIISWLTYSSYRSKRRPLEIRIGGQDSEHAQDLESGNGRSKHRTTTLIQQIVERLPQLKEEYKPYPGLTNRHVETIFAAFFRKLPNVRFRRECLAAPDGGTVALDWPVHGGKRASDDAMWGQELPAGAPVLILLPGLTGGSGDTYVRHMLVRARRAGFHTVVFNSRGCADSPVTSPQFYSASFTDDMRMVAAHVQQRFPASKLLAVGWSLGANILVRYLGQEGPCTPIAAAASLCNPFDLVKGDEGFRTGFGKVYDQSLAKSLNRIFQKHAPLFEGIGGDYNIPLVATAKTVRDFDEGLTRVCFGIPSVDEYYRQSSSINNIQDVAVPLMCIQAEDDPIAPNDGIPREKIEANPNTFLVVTPAGGHLGWIAGEEAPLGAPWTDPLVMDFFKAFLELQPSGPRDTPRAEQEVGKTLQEVNSSGEEALELSQSWNKR